MMYTQSQPLYQDLVVHLLSYELVFAERVLSFAGESVDWSFVDLLLDGTEEDKQRLASTLLGDNHFNGDQVMCVSCILSKSACLC